MKRVLIAAAALSALAGAAMAQPAYNPAEGGPPPNYPACAHRHEDRCVQHGAWRGHMGHHRWHRHRHSSTNGERG